MSDVTAESRDTVESLRSALCEVNEARQTAVQNKTVELSELQRTLGEEITHLRSALQKAEQKATRFW